MSASGGASRSWGPRTRIVGVMTVRGTVVDHVLFVVEDLGDEPPARAHIAFDAHDRGAVDAFFDTAIENDASARGEPGVWTQYSARYDAAFVNDLHSNNVEPVWHAAEPVTDAPMRIGVP